MMETEDRYAVCETIREETCRDDDTRRNSLLQVSSGHVRERRNSIPSITSIFNFTASISYPHRSNRSSVPNITLNPLNGATDDRDKYRQTSFPSYSGSSRSGAGSTSLHSSPSIRSRFKLYHYIKAGAGDQYNDLFKLDDTFAQIRSQLNNLSEENRTVRTRVHSLTEAVTELYTHFSTTDSCTDDEDSCDDDDFTSSNSDDDEEEQAAVHTNTMRIPFHRINSQPSHFSNGWHEDEEDALTYHSSGSYDDISWRHQLNEQLSQSLPKCIIMVNSQECDDNTSEEETFINYKNTS